MHCWKRLNRHAAKRDHVRPAPVGCANERQEDALRRRRHSVQQQRRLHLLHRSQLHLTGRRRQTWRQLAETLNARQSSSAARREDANLCVLNRDDIRPWKLVEGRQDGPDEICPH